MAPRVERGRQDDPVAAYKRLLRAYLDRRPSGTRLKIADAIGKHKSFVSQITNPAYPIPVPVRHLAAIMDICHFTKEERTAFLAAYRAAHPNQSHRLGAARPGGYRTLHIEVPLFDDPEVQHEIEDTIRQFARRIAALAQRGRD